MILDEETQQYIRLALLSHEHCVHEGGLLCPPLILSELAMRRGYPITSDEETEAFGAFLTDVILENLFRKGYVEFAGVTEEGEMTVGLTSRAIDSVEEKLKLRHAELYPVMYDCDFCGLSPDECDCGG